MKLKLRMHQKDALKKMKGKPGFALFMEQGTGKTATLLAEAEQLYSSGEIHSVLVIAPKGVHSSWVKREIPKCLSIPYKAAHYGSSARARKQVDLLFDTRIKGDIPELLILAMNYDALLTAGGMEVAKKFCLCSVRLLLILDESTRIKTPNAKRTEKCMSLKKYSSYRRIATGTPVAQSPIDVFQQMEFLEEGLLGTTSYRSFVSEYATLLSPEHNLVKDIMKRTGIANPRGAPQIVARDKQGKPMWKNLDKLHGLLEPHSFRVLKKDCLDLPEKIYETVYFEMEPEHRRAYDKLKKEQRITVEGELLTFNKLTVITKLQQVTSGFIKIGDEHTDLHNKQRLSALKTILQDTQDQAIIWARFKKEIEAICRLLDDEGHSFVEYHGGTNDSERETAIDAFQGGTAKYFVGHVQAGGTGLTLTAASTVIYFSNLYNPELRLQSEDRAHRIGTTKPVVYIDIVAEDSIDEAITSSFQRKKEVSDIILGD